MKRNVLSAVIIICVVILVFFLITTIKISDVEISKRYLSDQYLTIEMSFKESKWFEFKGYEINSIKVDGENALLITAYEKFNISGVASKIFEVRIPTETIKENNIQKIYYGTTNDYECIWEVEK